jgi:hypothetical protein
MSHEFDASLICSESVSPETLAQQQADVDNWMRMPSALSNAKLHAQRDLEARYGACNRLVWGYGHTPTRTPFADEIAGLLQSLDPGKREKLMNEARLAKEQRSLIALIEEGERRYVERLRAEEAEQALHSAARRELEEFEAFDLAGKRERFEAWRAQRGAY